ncbi:MULTISPECIES: Crp/Fnr family transcriptional regulator [Anaerotruncus]|jgi:CRP/FNR family transcriptional regulator|uniref:Crp/Fnr family transcriptional regulator n=2 Tax=Oscillospiraceae TaxID=216572 RepID=UPI000E51F270|nr:MULTISPECIES: Crp/Fnr family transcriptional regulator [Anaerotruncus]RGX55469.1 Crp/Fnr family transcriptional regulator [Anaerotruncus sp. AF02-27]
MPLGAFLPFWDQLSEDQRELLRKNAVERSVLKGTVIHNGSEDCVGLLVVQSGQLRASILSEEGREITLYRLFERDICLFSASCMLRSIQFDITVEAAQNSRFWLIPTPVYQRLMQQSAAVANYTNELMASRFSDVMWLMDQVLYKRLDSRLAAFLLEEGEIADTNQLRITHEMAARHLGSAREVVTRMLKYFQSEGIVALSRGTVTIVSPDKLRQLAADSLR